MAGEIRAQRAIVTIGSIQVDGFMLPDGSYRMSQTQAADCISDDAVYARNFLTSRALKALRGEGFTPETFEVDPSGQTRGQTRIRGWTLDIVYAYWVYRCFKGNQQAYALVVALGTETLERRFDRAFGISRAETEYNDRLIAYTRQLEASLADLGEAYAVDDDVRRENEFLRQRLAELGVDPYALPSDE